MLHIASSWREPKEGTLSCQAGRRAWALKGKEPQRLQGWALGSLRPSLPLSFTFPSSPPEAIKIAPLPTFPSVWGSSARSHAREQVQRLLGGSP